MRTDAQSAFTVEMASKDEVLCSIYAALRSGELRRPSDTRGSAPLACDCDCGYGCGGVLRVALLEVRVREVPPAVSAVKKETRSAHWLEVCAGRQRLWPTQQLLVGKMCHSLSRHDPIKRTAAAGIISTLDGCEKNTTKILKAPGKIVLFLSRKYYFITT